MHHLITICKSKEDEPNSNPQWWKVATQDGCAVNGAGIDHIHAKTAYTPNKNCCCSHTLCLVGGKFYTPILKLFKKRWNMCIRYKGKLVDQYKARFGEAPIKSGGIRWWIVFEQAMQLYEHGVTNVLEGVVGWGIANNASLKSRESMLGDF